MIYTLEGHALKHAVEEMLFHLLPTAALARADAVDAADGTGDYCRSVLTEVDGRAWACADIRIGGVTRRSEGDGARRGGRVPAGALPCFAGAHGADHTRGRNGDRDG